jgi:hypothetical protein
MRCWNSACKTSVDGGGHLDVPPLAIHASTDPRTARVASSRAAAIAGARRGSGAFGRGAKTDGAPAVGVAGAVLCGLDGAGAAGTGLVPFPVGEDAARCEGADPPHAASTNAIAASTAERRIRRW